MKSRLKRLEAKGSLIRFRAQQLLLERQARAWDSFMDEVNRHLKPLEAAFPTDLTGMLARLDGFDEAQCLRLVGEIPQFEDLPHHIPDTLSRLEQFALALEAWSIAATTIWEARLEAGVMPSQLPAPPAEPESWVPLLRHWFGRSPVLDSVVGCLLLDTAMARAVRGQPVEPTFTRLPNSLQGPAQA